MTIVGSGNFQFGLIVAAVLSVSLMSTPSRAYTPEQEQACSGDAFRICGSDIPDVDRITACMIRNRTQLSPGCRAFFRPEPGEGAVAPAGRPMSIQPVVRKSAKARKARKPARPAA